jgi:hypothetical protein
LNQKPINVIDCIKAVEGELRVPRVDSLKRHVLKRFQKVNAFESSILKDLSEKVSILYPNTDGVSTGFSLIVLLLGGSLIQDELHWPDKSLSRSRSKIHLSFS